MLTLHLSSHFSSFLRGRLALCWLFLMMATVSQAQTQASCTFKLFKPPIFYGVNDWGTVVGVVGAPAVAAIRYSNGSISYYLPSGAFSSFFTARNDNGVTVGIYFASGTGTGHAFMLKGSTLIQIDDPKAVPSSTLPFGINKYNSVVGVYVDSGAKVHGFKRYSNGSFLDIDYPGAVETDARGINDSGVIVGTYIDKSQAQHGFVYHSGQWATLDFPGSLSTYLFGISNTGVIVGVPQDAPANGGFLYVNGTFKLVKVPNSVFTQVQAIAPGGGLITGRTATNGFTATCH